MEYHVHKTHTPPSLDAPWDAPVWQQAETAQITYFHPLSSNHHPETAVRLLYDQENLYVDFRVRDRYVRAIQTDYQSPVCRDACVELFIQPRPDRGYFNLEINCIGTMLFSYVTDPTRLPGGEIAGVQKIPAEKAASIQVFSTLKGPVPEEIEEPVEWRLAYAVPFPLFAVGETILRAPEGETWRGNFYKCAEDNSHPHWGSWAPIGPVLNFHVPEYFAAIRFEA